jgi:hypothetical protein
VQQLNGRAGLTAIKIDGELGRISTAVVGHLIAGNTSLTCVPRSTSFDLSGWPSRWLLAAGWPAAHPEADGSRLGFADASR